MFEKYADENVLEEIVTTLHSLAQPTVVLFDQVTKIFYTALPETPSRGVKFQN